MFRLDMPLRRSSLSSPCSAGAPTVSGPERFAEQRNDCEPAKSQRHLHSPSTSPSLPINVTFTPHQRHPHSPSTSPSLPINVTRTRDATSPSQVRGLFGITPTSAFKIAAPRRRLGRCPGGPARPSPHLPASASYSRGAGSPARHHPQPYG